MNKFNQDLDELIMNFYLDAQDGDDVVKVQADIIALITPKLQWKSEEIRYSGGDILLSTVHTVSNYHTEIRIYEPVDGITHVAWNGHVIFEGTLDECKKYCSNKILNDFLKLCE